MFPSSLNLQPAKRHLKSRELCGVCSSRKLEEDWQAVLSKVITLIQTFPAEISGGNHVHPHLCGQRRCIRAREEWSIPARCRQAESWMGPVLGVSLNRFSQDTLLKCLWECFPVLCRYRTGLYKTQLYWLRETSSKQMQVLQMKWKHCNDPNNENECRLCQEKCTIAK